MNKNKKNKKDLAEESEEDVEIVLKTENASKNKKNENKETKNDKKVKKESSSEEESDDSDSDRNKKNASKKPSGFALLMDDDDDEDESSDEAPPPPPKSKSKKPGGFAMLMEDDDSDSEKEESESKPSEGGKKSPFEILENEKPEDKKPETKKKDKKKKKKKNDDDEDIDSLLAELKIEPKSKTDEDGFVIVESEAAKTAAQKKKDKKARQMEKLAAKKNNNEAQVEESKEPVEEAAEDDGDKKKKKKKKAKDKEEDEKKKKKPAKGTILAMQEALKKVQEEEAKQQREEEEKIAREEAAEEERLEKKRLEEERKLAKKEREKAKKEQLRKDGKLLTAKQKQQKAQAEAMLSAMRAQGMEVPAAGEKKGPRPGTRIRPKKAKSQTPEDVKEDEPKPVQVEIVDAKEEPKKEVPKDDVKDAWDASSEDEEEEEEKAEAKAEEKRVSEDEEEDSEEEDSEDEDSESEDSDDEDSMELNKREKALARIQKRRLDNEANRTTDVLRAPVVCVLGHVDTGKTKILDKLRRTNVQDGEAGGITQQIGATNVPIDVVKEQCKNVKDFSNMQLQLPGLLIIDTPGHESFSNLRDRGSSLCDIAILVVDIMHNLEPQTIESINMLKKKKTPFVVALNKIDRIYEWKSNRHRDIQDVVEMQQTNTRLEFDKRAKEVMVALAEQGLNAALFWENPDTKKYISVVPTSAHTGEGMGNLMGLLVTLSQSMLAKRLSFSEELQATVLEVKAISGLGTTIDIVLVNGTLREGSTIIVAGTDGPIVTQVKALLTPAKMQDLRVKVNYVEHKVLRAAQGVKISAKELEKAIAGLNLLVAYHPDEVDICKQEIQGALDNALNAIKLKQEGVFVQASTLGSLEALLEFLRTSKIPYAGVKIGPVVKRDVMKASVMLEHEVKYTVILAFDVKVEKDAQEMADSMGVKIFQADIIYHLFDRFTAYQEELRKEKREFYKHIAVFPCKIRILPHLVFNSRDPIVAGFIVEAGVVKTGTPVCVPSKDMLDVGVITSIQNNHKELETARKGDEVCIKIEPIPGESPKMFGRHFDEKDMIVSKISRASIDACKNYFRDDLQKSDWQLMVELKKTFEIL